MTRACVQVDVSGESMTLRDLHCSRGDWPLRFVIDPMLKRNQSFALGLFFSKSCLSNEVMRYPRSQRACVLTESPIAGYYRNAEQLARRFPVVFTHQRNLVELGAPFTPLFLGTNWVSVIDTADSTKILQESAHKTGNVSFFGSIEHSDDGAYRFRREVAEYALERGDVACFGKGIRPLASKVDGISPYRFSIAMENAASDWYFSEKLVDCILLDTIPIYYGCPALGSLLDERGFLAFSNLAELTAILDRLGPDLYEAMLPYARANKRKLVAERWHSHAGLLQRLAEHLPAEFLSKAPIRYAQESTLRRYAWRIRERLSVARSPRRQPAHD